MIESDTAIDFRVALFCKTRNDDDDEDSNSNVRINVRNFDYYFYVGLERIDSGVSEEDMYVRIGKKLESTCVKQYGNWVKAVHRCNYPGRSIFGFKLSEESEEENEDKIDFNEEDLVLFKVTVTYQGYLNRYELERIIRQNILSFKFRDIVAGIYGISLDWQTLFLNDKRISGCDWFAVDLPALREFYPSDPSFKGNRKLAFTRNCWNAALTDASTFCPKEMIISYDQLKSISDPPQPLRPTELPVLSVLSFNVVCLSESDDFPDPRINPIVVIGCISGRITTGTQLTTESATVFYFGKEIINDPEGGQFPNTVLFQYSSEIAMLLAFSDYVKKLDPDIFIGFNADSFDLPYIFERGKALTLPSGFFSNFGRTLGEHGFIVNNDSVEDTPATVLENGYFECQMCTKPTKATTINVTGNGPGPSTTASRFVGKLHDYFLHLRQAHSIVHCRDGLYGNRKGTRSVRCIYCLDRYPHKYHNDDTGTIQDCCFLLNRQSSSSSQGARQRHKRPATTISGRLMIDMLSYSREHMPSLPSYSLKALSEKILREKYELLDHGIIASKYASDDGGMTLCEYCLRGATLTLELFDKLNSLQTLWELSKLIGLPIQRLIDKRVINQKNVLSIISKYVSSSSFNIELRNRRVGNQRQRVWIIPSKTTMRNAYPEIETDGGSSYEGGYVVKPEIGYYRETPVLVGDFDSMYPSFIVAHNLCYSTFILPKYYDKHRDKFVNVCNWVRGVNDRGTSFIPPKIIVYIQHPKMREWKFAIGVRSIIPRIEQLFMDTRGRIKTELSSIGTISERDKRVLRVKESVVKLISNSFYGVMGINFKGAIAPFTMLAQTVTCLGKHYNKFVREYAHARGYRTIYGDTDSVMLLNRSSSLPEMTTTTTEQMETKDYEYEGTEDMILCLKKWHDKHQRPSIECSSTLSELVIRKEREKKEEKEGDNETDTRISLVSSSMQRGIRLMEDVSRSFAPPINVSYQNIFLPFLIEKKKQYIAGAYSYDPTLKGRQIVAKGLIRKDAFKLFNRLLQTVINMIVDGTSSEQMTEFLTAQLSSCIAHSPVEDFICITELKSREHFATKERALSQPHTAVAWDIFERTGKRPKVGDLIEYVIVDPFCSMNESEIRNYLYHPEFFVKPKHMNRVSLRSYRPERVLATQRSFTSSHSQRLEIDYCHYLNRICSGLEGIVWTSSRLTDIKLLCQRIKDEYKKNRLVKLQRIYNDNSGGSACN